MLANNYVIKLNTMQHNLPINNVTLPADRGTCEQL